MHHNSTDTAAQPETITREAELAAVEQAATWHAGWTLIAGFRVSKQPVHGYRRYNYIVGKRNEVLSRPAAQTPGEAQVEAAAMSRAGRTVLVVQDHPEHPLVTIDVDRHGGRTPAEVMDLLAAYGVPRTPVVVLSGREGGGFHLRFRREKGAEHMYASRNAAVGLAELGLEGDCKARGAYVVAPYCLHRTGAPYRLETPYTSAMEAYAETPVLPLDAFLRVRNGLNWTPSDKGGSTSLRRKTGPAASRGKNRSGGSLNAENGVIDLRGVQPLEEWKRAEWTSADVPEDRSECPLCAARSALRTDGGTYRCHSCKTVFQLPSVSLQTSAYHVDITRVWSGWSGQVVPLSLRDGYVAPSLVDARIEVWAAGMGRGKTVAAVEAAQAAGMDTVVVTPLRSLTSAAARLFSVTDYQTVSGPLRGSVAVCAPSLARVHPSGPYVLVADEIEQTLAQLVHLGGEIDRRAVLTRLRALVAGAAKVILLDAHAGPLTGWLLGSIGAEAQTVWRPGPVAPARPVHYISETSAHDARIIADADEAAARGLRIAVACMSRGDAAETARLLRDRGHRVLLVTRDERPDLSAEALNACTALVYSPALATGVSLDQRNYWLCTHLRASNNSGDGHMAQQMMARVRYPVRPEVYVSGPAGSAPTHAAVNPETYRARAQGRVDLQQQTLNLVGMPSLTDLSVSEEARNYLDLWSRSRAEQARNGLGWTARWLCGAAVEAGEDVRVEALVEEKKEIRRELLADWANEVGQVSDATLDVVEAADDDRAELAPAVRAALTLRKRYGRAAETPEQRRELAHTRTPEALWARTERFGQVWASTTPQGLAALARLDAAERGRQVHVQVTPRVGRAALALEGFRRLGLDITGVDESPVELPFELVENWLEWANANARLLRAAGIPISASAAPRKTLGVWLAYFGIGTERIGVPGVYTYRVRQASLVRMRDLAARARSDLLLVPAPAARASA